MLKKLISILIAVVMVTSIGAAVLATGEDEAPDALAKIVIEDMEGTEQFLVTITRPDGDETTFKKSYAVCGETDRKNVKMVFAMYNPDTGKYEEFENTDGESRWEIGEFGFFGKEVELAKGANKMKIIAYVEAEDGSLVAGTNLQVNYFTVTLLEESLIDKIKNSVVDITDVFTQIFK